MDDEEKPAAEKPRGPAGPDSAESEERAIRRRRALERPGKIAVYSTPLVIGLLSSDAWSESG
jgi:hypothetical protein